MKTSLLHTYTRYIILSLTILSMVSGTIFSAYISSVEAAYVESDSDSFVGYKRKIESALQDMEREFRVNNTNSDATISNLRALIQEAYIRLPDSGDAAGKNEGLKKSTDLYLDLAVKNKSSSTHAANAASQIARFLADAQIGQITGSINANPASGNAPLTSSFVATAKDPSGINVPDRNYIWWMRESGGYRRELGRGPILTYTFSKEGNYQIFLDVVSESRNKKGKVDVTPLTVSQDIEVKPRLGNIIFLINGVNVSNLDTLKISPTLGKIGLLFDATASRAVSNGVITKTKWDFGNGNILEYDGAPILEKQLYVNPEMYKVSLEITTNQGQTFRKQLQLLIRDPAAVISLDKEVAHIDEDINMSAKSYLTNATNVEYTWEVQDVNDAKKIITSKAGSAFNYKFKQVGQYLITLTTRNPNGETDKDSRVIVIEARAPTINLDTPKSISTEKPNTIFFDASRSFDADTNNTKGLSYEWSIDGEKVTLTNTMKDGAMGSYTFAEKGSHTVSLTVSNPNGKVSTTDKTFEVTSTLTVGINISPRATPIGSTVGFQARSPKASFYEWDFGDGSPSVNGTSDFVQHIYKKTGIYTINLGVKSADGTEENRISRKVYITDTDKPYALIDIKNTNGTVVEDPTACENPNGAFIINRSDTTTIDGGNSINTDGNPAGLDYTWEYMDRIKTGPSLSEKFTELGCHQIKLTVKSGKNGASHTSTRYIQIKNIAPKITSVDASIDPTKKNTQKLIVNVIANGARDEDGVITSYIWFYTTESDQEKQNIRITQTPNTTFVLPNVTEKYYFSVIAEDNDGARYDTSENVTDQKPLLIANDDSNINMPLISLTLDKSQALAEEVIRFSVKAKNILGNDITAKSEYYWDFDGDSRIDQKTTDPNVTYAYKKSGKYNMKVKVVYNGVSNTKYQIVYVKNELKASVAGYRINDTVYFLNTSRGIYDSAKWNIANVEGTSLHSMSIKNALLSNASGSNLGNLTIKYGVNEISSVDIRESDISQGATSGSGGIFIQSYPLIQNDSITVVSPSDTVLISLYGNLGKEYKIDSDTKIDSDVDSVSDNDVDNKNTPSYEDGSVYAIENLANVKTRTRTLRITIIGQNNQIIGTKDVTLIFDFIPEQKDESAMEISGTGSIGFSTNDKNNLDKLQSIVRTLNPEDRIIFTQHYNRLIENWGDLSDRTEGLLTLQKEVNLSQSLDTKTKEQLSDIIDLTLVGDAQAVNDVSIASHVIEGLIPSGSINRTSIIEKLEQIKANPGNLTENKLLGKSILEMIEGDSSLSTENKLLIKSQLLTIVNGGQESISETDKNALVEESVGGSGLLGFISGAVKIFLAIIGIILFLFLIGFIFYRFSRKHSDMGFQDFLIDSIAHTKSNEKKDTTADTIVSKPKIPVPIKKEEPESIIIPPVSPVTVDPLADIDTNISDTSVIYSDPLSAKSAEAMISSDTSSVAETTPSESDNIPDWLKSVSTPLPASRITDDSASIVYTSETPVIEKTPESVVPEIIVTPDTTQAVEDTPPIITTSPEESVLIPEIVEKNTMDSEVTPEGDIPIPDWLLPESPEKIHQDDIETQDSDIGEPVPVILPPPGPDAELPDWLKNSFDTAENTTETEPSDTPVIQLSDSPSDADIIKPEPKKKGVKKKIVKPTPADTPTKKPSTPSSDIPDWLK